MAVTLKDINLKDRKTHPNMVGWFNFEVLADAARRTILSAIFGEYADRRLIHAALDHINTDVAERLLKIDDPSAVSPDRTNFSNKINADSNGDIWVDYVADLGDGFDSTYAIAYSLSQQELRLKDGLTLPRGQVLVMGGDQVYPTASREEYERRLDRPYKYAFPNNEADGAPHPLLFLIPGNHDWYDGLTLFLAKFCRGFETPFGSWCAYQSRSYFAVKLTETWWIWGMDTQLGEDVDMPQSLYFKEAARKIGDKAANVILCSSVPSWNKADSRLEEERKAFGRGINHIGTEALKDNCPNAKIYAVVSGDQHHYSRYTSEKSKTQFITAGGGGAFLHTTHHLKNKINNINWFRHPEPLTLATREGHKDELFDDGKACFPNRCRSRLVAWSNLLFPIINPLFCLYLGGVYAVVSVLLTWGRITRSDALNQNSSTDILTSLLSPTSIILWLGFMALFRLYADKENELWRFFAGAMHGSGQFACVILALCLYPHLSWPDTHLWLKGNAALFYQLLEVTLVAGSAGGTVWGLYLFIASFIFKRHYNDASSSMRHSGYKNFLRMKISGDQLTIYPMGLKKAPKRSDWQVTSNPGPGEALVTPKKPLDVVLIEEPIIINLR